MVIINMPYNIFLANRKYLNIQQFIATSLPPPQKKKKKKEKKKRKKEKKTFLLSWLQMHLITALCDADIKIRINNCVNGFIQ